MHTGWEIVCWWLTTIRRCDGCSSALWRLRDSDRNSWSSSGVTSPVGDAPHAHGMGDRVLVVDDDPPLRRMLERTLAAEGFEVTLAADGGAALVAAERSAPDVIDRKSTRL